MLQENSSTYNNKNAANAHLQSGRGTRSFFSGPVSLGALSKRQQKTSDFSDSTCLRHHKYSSIQSPQETALTFAYITRLLRETATHVPVHL